MKTTKKLVKTIRFDLHFPALDHLLQHMSDFSRITTSQWMFTMIFRRRDIGFIQSLTNLEKKNRLRSDIDRFVDLNDEQADA